MAMPPQMRSNINSAAWQIGTSATMLEVAQKERPSAKALFSVVSQQTGLETPEEFSDKYLRIEAMVRPSHAPRALLAAPGHAQVVRR